MQDKEDRWEKEALLNYYQDNHFNPVLINIEDNEICASHVSKRINLYQKRLGIPLGLIKNKSILEFGCNSGENSLYLAKLGAKLTLVDPNKQIFSRLKQLYSKYVDMGIVNLIQDNMGDFQTDKEYDLVIAEGFLATLKERDAMIKKMGQLLSNGGLGIVSFNCRYGSLVEFIKFLLADRICELKGVRNQYSEEGLEVAREIFKEEYDKINFTRPFDDWWIDSLNPCTSEEFLWSYQEILSLLEEVDCEFYSSSPKWDFMEYFKWYKQINDKESYNKNLIKEWEEKFPFILTGIRTNKKNPIPDLDTIESVPKFLKQISDYKKRKISINKIEYPLELDYYLKYSQDTFLQDFNEDLKNICEAIKKDAYEIIKTYKKTKVLKNLWGTPYHHICFTKKMNL